MPRCQTCRCQPLLRRLLAPSCLDPLLRCLRRRSRERGANYPIPGIPGQAYVAAVCLTDGTCRTRKNGCSARARVSPLALVRSISTRFGKANAALKRFDLVCPLREWKVRIEAPPNSLLLEAAHNTSPLPTFRFARSIKGDVKKNTSPSTEGSG